jgi:hypothetical protein
MELAGAGHSEDEELNAVYLAAKAARENFPKSDGDLEPLR